ncbi:MAG: hypothetical protein ACLFPJ_05045, partial [Candidatus Woesearchaeota archaeon]
YGQSKTETCVFCSKNATTQNLQGFAVCKEHKSKQMEDKKCVCGEYLDLKKGKYGMFYICINCGPMSLSKVDEMKVNNSNIKLNKKFREKENKVYTLDELDKMWDDV